MLPVEWSSHDLVRSAPSQRSYVPARLWEDAFASISVPRQRTRRDRSRLILDDRRDQTV